MFANFNRRKFIKLVACATVFPRKSFSSEHSNRIRVGGIYTKVINNRWVRRVHTAALHLNTRGEISYSYTDAVENEDYKDALAKLSLSGVDMIIGDAYQQEELARQISLNYPRVLYLMGSVYPPNSQFANFSVFDSYIQDAAYLSGIIGGALTKSRKIGIIARYPHPSINRLVNAFIDGIRELETDIRITVDFQDAVYDLPKAKILTDSQIDSGIDLILADAPGVAKFASDRSIPIISTFDDSDKANSNTFVTSSLWHFEPTLQAAIDQIKMSGIESTDYSIYSYLRQGGCSLAPIVHLQDQLSEDIIERVVKREFEMRSYRFSAAIKESNPNSS